MRKPELPKLRIPGKCSSSDVQKAERWSSFDATGRWHPGRGLQAEVAQEKQQEEEKTVASCSDEAHLGHLDRACVFVRKAIAFLLRWNSQHHIKRVDASLQVLKTYHKSLLYGDVPLGGRIRMVIRQGHIGYVWYVLVLNLSLLSGVLYVYSTYAMGAGLYIKNVQDFISLVFFMDYVLRVFCEPATLYYVFSLRGIVELLSFVPLAFLFNGPGRGSRFIHLLQLLRIVRIFSCLGDIGIVGSTATQQIILLVVATIGVVFLDAGILQWLEAGRSSLTYWQSFYFFIVTVSTVGYGDIVPSSILGQVLAVLTIIATVVILPSQIGKITSVASRRPYGQSFSSWRIVDSRFIVISGNVKLKIIQEFLAELFNPAYFEDLAVYPLCVVIMAPFRPSFELKQLLSLYGENVAFMEGSATCQSDLERVNAAKAAAFFLLADANAEDAKIEDAAQIVRALAVQNFCSGNVRVIVEVLEPATQSSAVWNHSNKGCIEVICPAKIHYKMLSRSCFIRGFYTFVTNLFTYGIQMKLLANNHFFSEYVNSFSNNLYPCIFPTVFSGLLFEEVVDFFFTAYNVLLIGLDIPILSELNGQSERTVLLYPKGHFIGKDDVGLLLAANLQTIQSISALTRNELRKGFFQNTLDYIKKIGKFNDSQDKLDLLEQICARWTHEKSRASISRQLVIESYVPEINHGARAEPSSPHGHGKLKKHLVNVMYRNLLEHCGESVPAELVYWNKVDDMEEFNSYSKDKIPTPQSSSIQTAAEELLAWPPSLQYGRPHPAVLERKTDVIFKNLGERTIPIVELQGPHFLVCCQGSWPNNIYYLLAGLRSPIFPKLPVVILHPQTPSAFQWGSVGIFDDIFFLQGSPLYEVDLLRAGILQSEKVVVLVDQGALVDISGKGDEEDARDARKSSVAYATDVDNIVIAANIEQIFGKRVSKLVVEMQHATALHYLQPQYPLSKDRFSVKDYKRNPHGHVYFTLPYIEGKAVSGSMLGFLLRSTFYNKNTVSIIEQLVDGGPVKLYEGLSKDHIRVLEQIPVPKQHVNHPYSDMFFDLLTRHKMLALGLYRPQGTLGSVVPYVHTNPQKETILREEDLVFVLK